MFQQVPLNVIESNTELISLYKKKRSVDEILSSGISGISRYSADSVESLSEGALLALATMAELIREEKDIKPSAKADSFIRELANEKNFGQSEQSHSRSKRFVFEPTDRINSIFSSYEMLASDFGRKNCFSFSHDQRKLPGDVIYGVDVQFESQAKLALSIAHFLSSFYQIINPNEDFPLRNAEKSLTEDNIYAEVISSVAADFKAVGVGIFFDRNKFSKKKPYFGPYAFRNRDSLNVEIQKHYQMVDLTGMPDGYINEDWFTVIYLFLFS